LWCLLGGGHRPCYTAARTNADHGRRTSAGSAQMRSDRSPRLRLVLFGGGTRSIRWLPGRHLWSRGRSFAARRPLVPEPPVLHERRPKILREQPIHAQSPPVRRRPVAAAARDIQHRWSDVNTDDSRCFIE
jgi:hypothetical protein